MPNAGLYMVHGPIGDYYAIFDPATGRLWTERSVHAARAVAKEAGLELDSEKTITHQSLMRLTGRDMRHPSRTAPPASPLPRSAPSGPAASPAPITSRTPFGTAESTRPILTSKAGQSDSVFAAGTPVAPDDASTMINRDVLNDKPALPKRAGKSPFADPKPRRTS